MVGLVKRRNAALLLGILALAAGFRLWGIAWGLHDANVSRRPHPDEWPIYWLFQWFGSTHSLNPCPATTRCFFDWGSVYPYLSYGAHALLAPLLGLVPPHTWGSSADPLFVNSVLTGRLVSVLTSTMTVLIVFYLGSQAYGTATGLAASLLAALSGLLIQLAHFATPDSTTVLLVTLDLLAMVLAMKRPSAPRFALSGLALGLAVGCEYHMVLLAIPLLVSWLLARPRQGSWLLAAGACALSALVI
ncbi:MAG: glycosyltransferase family 39 protein, partial [Chloroflexi bacterium]|nr:glycosyltransferase family 39 protein [Chloroflexota bacterium]